MNVPVLVKSGLLEKYAREQLTEIEVAAVDMLLEVSMDMGEELEHIYTRIEKSCDFNLVNSIKITPDGISPKICARCGNILNANLSLL